MKTTPLFALLAIGTYSSSAAVALFEDFEDATVTYTTSVADDLSDIANRDYFGRIAPDTSTPPGTVAYLNPQGAGYYGAQDTDGANSGNIDDITLNFLGVDITGFSNLSFSGFFAEDSDGGNEDWDQTSSVIISVQIDSGGFVPVLAFEAENSAAANSAPRQDTNFDGTGDGAPLTDTFTSFSSGITETGTVLDLRIVISTLDAGDEDIALDSIMIEGDMVPEPSSALLGGIALLALLRRRR